VFVSATSPRAAAKEPTPNPAQILAPGWDQLAYPAPAPGSYELPSLGEAADGEVLDTSGSSLHLHDLLGDKVVVLSFIYLSCPDVNACPLATYVLSSVQRRILGEPHIRDHVRLITLSFDPSQDRPEVVRRHASHIVAEGSDWRFLTTESEQALAPILEAYGQSIHHEYDEDGKPIGTISHILRVYLIDRQKSIRNIYTTSFLHTATLTSDIETLLLEGDGVVAQTSATETDLLLQGPGDDRRGYEHGNYRTHSKDLTARTGRPADLMALHAAPPLGLPPVPVPADNPVTEAKAALGRKLFFDRRLSRNETISCAMCHVPEQGFAHNELATAIGIEGRTVRRNAPTIYNAAYASLLFHDGRERQLEHQIWGPLLAVNEMGNPSIGYLLDKIRRLPDYAGLFEAAFGGDGPTLSNVGMALASYERTLLSAGSPFDRWRFGGEEGALSAEAKRGFALFSGKADCVACHRIDEQYALFTDQRLHNTGVGYRQAMGRPAERLEVQVSPGVFLDIDPTVTAAATERRPNDLGLYEITEQPQDRWKYRTPTLRNVALTAPYMHDGSMASLREVIEFYNAGGVPNEVLDPLIRPLGLSENEIADLVAFLESLTGGNVDELVEDAFAAPVGDPR
jgi:cytochrome c peroxidase